MLYLTLMNVMFVSKAHPHEYQKRCVSFCSQYRKLVSCTHEFGDWPAVMGETELFDTPELTLIDS